MQPTLEAIPSRPNPDLSRPSAEPALPEVGSQAHSTLLGKQLGRQGWLWVGAVSAAMPLHLSPCGAKGLEPRLCTVVSSWLHSSLVLYEHLHLVDKVPGNPQDLLRVVTLSTFWGRQRKLGMLEQV